MKVYLGRNGGIHVSKTSVEANELYHRSPLKMKWDGCRFYPKYMAGFSVFTQDEVSKMYHGLKLQQGEQIEIDIQYKFKKINKGGELH